MNPFLLLDFGASRIKSAIVDLDTGFFSNIKSYPSIPANTNIKGQCEIPLNEIKSRFLQICDLYFNELDKKFNGIVICSEMHGFALLDKDNEPITEYISWKDERSLCKIDGIDTFTLFNQAIGNDFKYIAGMKSRSGFPVVNAIHIGRTSKLNNDIKIVSIPEWLALACSDAQNKAHVTMTAGLGFYDINNRFISDKISDLFKDVTGVKLRFNEIISDVAVAGYWHNNSIKIPIYTGIGDHQCAVLGAGNKPKSTFSINLGTGSQVAVINAESKSESIELRPFFNSDLLSTITHIPAGRVFLEYIGFLEDISRYCDSTNADFWKRLGDLKIEDINSASLNFDLALFTSAWNYKSGGMISNISEGSLTLNNYLASLIKSFTKQYLEAINEFKPLDGIEYIILSGGMSNKLPVLSDVFSSQTGYKAISATNIDETFLGLRNIALVCAGYAEDCYSAQDIYGRNAEVEDAK